MVNKMRCLAVLIARGGSKRVPRKNLQLIGPHPLIAHPILKFHELTKLIQLDHIISTDDLEIKSVAESYGGNCPFIRPADLAQDNVPSLPVVQHAINYLLDQNVQPYDVIVYVQPTSPFWRITDFLKCIDILNTTDVSSCVPVTPVSTHPFKMKRLLSDGRLLNYIDQGKDEMRAAQLLPSVMRRAGSLYASRIDVVMKEQTLIADHCHGFVVPSESAIDIDTPVDLAMARVIYDTLKSKY